MEKGQESNSSAQIVEPTTGSAVIVDPGVNKVPDNGFPVGYGPNESMKKVEKPKKPSFKERIKHTIGHMSKKAKRTVIIITALLVLSIGGFVIYAVTTGMFRIDYSGTYAAAKSLRTEMQNLKSDANCDRVTEYVNSGFTTMQVYTAYIDACKTVGHGVTEDLVLALGDTQGVLRDIELAKKYDMFKMAIDAAKTGNANVEDVLNKYAIWHQWIITEENGDANHNEWDWTEADIENASDILTKSKVDEFIEYGTKWKEYKLAAAKAYGAFYHTALDTLKDMNATRDKMNNAQKEFNKFKEENEINIVEEFPLELVDTAKLYSIFAELYDYVRTTYQNNYNYKVGGCKELVNSVVCD